MNEQSRPKQQNTAAELGELFLRMPAQQHELVQGLMKATSPNSLDPLNLGGAFMELAQAMTRNPMQMLDAQFDLARDYARLWQNTAQKALGLDVEPVATPDPGDRRFRHDDWSEHLLFDFLKQSYLVTSRWVQTQVEEAEGLDEVHRKKVRFYTKQFTDAVSPTNFLLTNPEVLRETVRTRGANVVRGLRNLLNDFDVENGKLNISMTDKAAFEVGRNVATAPGKVVFQNDVFQLLQFEPATATQFQVPLLIFPPWINKYYILDLKPENSFIRWALSQGHSVFVVSWVNPDERLAAKTWEDYYNEGISEAIDATLRACDHDQVHAIGYCIGGTLLASGLACMAANDDKRVKMATFFAAQVDFSEPGDLEVFIDEKQLANLDTMMAKTGFLDASAMSTSFNMLRANDLIWTFVINNYLMGKDPYPFDLLYWNADSTRMPRALHMFYLQQMYQHNRLSQPGGITLNATPVDLRRISIPVYLQASREDHIAPYNSVFKAAGLYQGPVRFVLAGSGHIAGVINPPASGKYCHWTNDAAPGELDAWLAGSTEHKGSWWPDWHAWAAPQLGEQVPARAPGSGGLQVIEDAPGSYVRA
ncbi:MAG: class I poly(R)-hydroxyalkanoic acid synthase [Gammaproteobacteria bacterium]|nr:class I poly(R)-hydroxyalkanoic acid synthase [Gammaproteobacteria bacterium]